MESSLLWLGGVSVGKKSGVQHKFFDCMKMDKERLELEEVKKLLATAGYTLSASSRFDLIIMYLIENSEYNIHFANIVLDDYGEGTLSR